MKPGRKTAAARSARRAGWAAIAAGLSMLAAGPAFAISEDLTVLFTMPDGGVTTFSYEGSVLLTVSGSGNSLFGLPNDAFYIYSGAPVHDPFYYQLTFGVSPLVPVLPSQNAVNFIPGGLPAYRSDHIYTFVLDTGAASPTRLHFGVGDGNFSDNGGAYRIRVQQLGGVPEPGTWALMITGFGLAGAVMRRRKAGMRATASATASPDGAIGP